MKKYFNAILPGDLVYNVDILYDMYLIVRIYKVSEIKRDGNGNISNLWFGDKGCLLLMENDIHESMIFKNFYSDLDEFIEKYNETYAHVKEHIKNSNFEHNKMFKYRALPYIRKINQNVRDALIRRESLNINLYDELCKVTCEPF